MIARDDAAARHGGATTATTVIPNAAALDAEVARILAGHDARPLALVSELLARRLAWYVTFVMLHNDFRVLDDLSSAEPVRVVEPRRGIDDPVRLVLARGGRGVLQLDTAAVRRGTLTARLFSSLGHQATDEPSRSAAARAAAGAGSPDARDVLVAPLVADGRVLGLLVAHPAAGVRSRREVTEALVRVADRVGDALRTAGSASGHPRTGRRGASPAGRAGASDPGPGRADAQRAVGRARSWDLPFDPASVALARSLVADACCGWGGTAPVATVELVTSELVANAVRHGWGSVRVTAAQVEEGLLIEVLDANPEPPVRRNPGDAAEGGFGIEIIARLARWGWRPETSGKTVWALVPGA